MILQALVDYYDRCRADPDETIPDFGYAPQQVGWVLHIGKDGSLVADPEDIRSEGENGKLRGETIMVPVRGSGRAGSKPPPQFLWDNTKYVLGADGNGVTESTIERFQSFRSFHENWIGENSDVGLRAFLRFLQTWDPHEALELPHWKQMAGDNCAFRFEGDRWRLHDREAAQEIWDVEYPKTIATKPGRCLITGKTARIGKLHGKIKGLSGPSTDPAERSLVSFNDPAFRSYQKPQSFNAPVSVDAAFKYTTALNHLTRYGSRQRTRVGDTDVLFWADEISLIEPIFWMSVDPMNETEPTTEVRNALEEIRRGQKPRELQLESRFCVLGLTGNSARIAVRFWYVSSISEISDRIGKHFEDLRIVGSQNDPAFPAIGRLLIETVRLDEKRLHDRTYLRTRMSQVSPTLAAAVMRSILTDTPYPNGLLTAILNRIRSDGRITYLRAALIKAVLARGARLGKRGEEVTVKLDKSSTSVPYLLGRLFAILESIQKDANPGINATIKDRYYGAASATPASVFGQLVRLSASHIKKSDKRPYHEGLIQEVMGEIGELPKQLNLEDQGRFALGYYHQRQWLYTKKEDREEE